MLTGWTFMFIRDSISTCLASLARLKISSLEQWWIRLQPGALSSRGVGRHPVGYRYHRFCQTPPPPPFGYSSACYTPQEIPVPKDTLLARKTQVGARRRGSMVLSGFMA